MRVGEGRTVAEKFRNDLQPPRQSHSLRQIAYFRCSDIGKQNPSGYANPKYDDLLRRSAATLDLAARATILAEAETLMIADAPIAPIFHYVSKTLVKPYVQGWVTNVQDVHPTRWLSVKK